jgi:hypothetical protein
LSSVYRIQCHKNRFNKFFFLETIFGGTEMKIYFAEHMKWFCEMMDCYRDRVQRRGHCGSIYVLDNRDMDNIVIQRIDKIGSDSEIVLRGNCANNWRIFCRNLQIFHILE